MIKMGKIVLAFMLLGSVKTISYWFDFDTSSGGSGGYLAVVGPNQEYVIRGRTNEFAVHTMDFVNGQASGLPMIDIGSHSDISSYSRTG